MSKQSGPTSSRKTQRSGLKGSSSKSDDPPEDIARVPGVEPLGEAAAVKANGNRSSEKT